MGKSIQAEGTARAKVSPWATSQHGAVGEDGRGGGEGVGCEGETGTGPEPGHTGPDGLGRGVRGDGAHLLMEGILGLGVCGEWAAEGRPARMGWWEICSPPSRTSPRSTSEEPGARIPVACKLEGLVSPGKPEGLGAWVRGGNGGGGGEGWPQLVGALGASISLCKHFSVPLA